MGDLTQRPLRLADTPARTPGDDPGQDTGGSGARTQA